MTIPSTLIFDIESVPDLAALRRQQHMEPSTTDDDVLKEAQFHEHPIKPAMQQIVAIAVAWIAPNGALRRLTALGEPSWSEAELIQEMFRIIIDGRPRLVGWNTSGFDLPVLVYRGMVHHIAVPGFYQFGEPYQGYRKRFDENSHIDLMDILSFYGASTRLKLDEMATILGFPGKLGIDGSHVWPLYQTGDLETVRTYCETDVLTTALVYGRYAEHRGWWDTTQYTTFEQSVATWLAAHESSPWDIFRTQWHPQEVVFGGHAPA